MASGSNLRRNSFYNLLGAVLPIAVSLVTIPLYLSHVGEVLYGLLTIVWMLQGYFGFFDFGLSMATSNQLAKLADATERERETVFWTSLILNVVFGLIGTVVLYFIGELLVRQFFKIDPIYKGELLSVMPWIAASVPVTTIRGALTGSLEGQGKFGALNFVQVLSTAFFQIFPLASSYIWGVKLDVMIPATIIGGIISIVLLFVTNIVAFPLRFRGMPDLALGRKLFGYGIWVTVTSLASPLLEVADRFVIGSMIGTKAVAYYNVPFTLAIRLKILPSVVSRTIFPHLSALGEKDSHQFFERTVQSVVAMMTPCVVIGLFALQPFLALWVNPAFSVNSAPIGRIVMLGVWLACLSCIPTTYLTAIGRPKVVAILNTVELLPFLGVLWVLIHFFGLKGAAVAWSLRVAVDAGLLFWVSGTSFTQVRKVMPAILLLILSYALSSTFAQDLLPAILYGAACTLLTVIWARAIDDRVRSICDRVMVIICRKA